MEEGTPRLTLTKRGWGKPYCATLRMTVNEKTRPVHEGYEGLRGKRALLARAQAASCCCVVLGWGAGPGAAS